MTAQFVAELERALQIDLRAGAPMAGRGDAQRFGGGLDREPCAAVLLAGVHYSEANAGAGDRGALNKLGTLVAAENRNTVQITGAGTYRTHLAEISDDAGEHDLDAHKIFDCIGPKFLTAAECERAGQGFKRHSFERIDSGLANGLIAAQ